MDKLILEKKVTFYNAQDGIKKTIKSFALTLGELKEDFINHNLSFNGEFQKIIVTALDESIVNNSIESDSSSVPNTDYIAMVFNKESKAGISRKEVYAQINEHLNGTMGEDRKQLVDYFSTGALHWTNVSSDLLLERIEALKTKVADDTDLVEEVALRMKDEICSNAKSIGVIC